MNRRIFRGKRLDNGEWISSGSLIRFLDDGIEQYYIPQYAAKCITNEDEFGNLLSLDSGTFYKVDPATVGQYVGVKDRNGINVFEGDLIWDLEFDARGRVAWDARLLAWVVIDDHAGHQEMLEEFVIAGTIYEVFGNIYDESAQEVQN